MLCPHCKLPSLYLFEAEDSNRKHPGKFEYFRGPCGLIFIDQVPDNISEYYASGYDEIPTDTPGLAVMAIAESHRLDVIKQHVKPGKKFLEIGPWIGLAAYNAVLAGYSVSSMEFNTDCVDLMKRSGINAVQTDDPAKTLHESNECFDVIAMWHSIEHLPRPWEVIEEAAKKINPSGLLLVAAPNPESAQLKIYGKNWYHLDAPRHIYFPPADMIEAIGTKYGLKVIERTTEDRLGKIVERDGWRQAIHKHVPIPGLRWIYKVITERLLRLRYRQRDDFAGAGYTIIMQKSVN